MPGASFLRGRPFAMGFTTGSLPGAGWACGTSWSSAACGAASGMLLAEAGCAAAGGAALAVFPRRLLQTEQTKGESAVTSACKKVLQCPPPHHSCSFACARWNSVWLMSAVTAAARPCLCSSFVVCCVGFCCLLCLLPLACFEVANRDGLMPFLMGGECSGELSVSAASRGCLRSGVRGTSLSPIRSKEST